MNTNCPDESFFQTLLMNSPYSNTQKDYLHYIDWSQNQNSPKDLSLDDYSLIKNSSKLFARKINENYELIDLLIKNNI